MIKPWRREGLRDEISSHYLPDMSSGLAGRYRNRVLVFCYHWSRGWKPKTAIKGYVSGRKNHRDEQCEPYQLAACMSRLSWSCCRDRFCGRLGKSPTSYCCSCSLLSDSSSSRIAKRRNLTLNRLLLLTRSLSLFLTWCLQRARCKWFFFSER